MGTTDLERRHLLAGGLGLALVACANGAAPARAASDEKGEKGKSGKEEKGGEDVSPAEDLMREHGALNRILLIYEEGIRRLELPAEASPVKALAESAEVVRRFIEDYHERLEEDFLFPRLEKAPKLTALVGVLRQQHAAGRKVTADIVRLSTPAGVQAPEGKRQLSGALRAFIRMYRPHEAREDTEVFPALPTVFSRKELDELGERFEDKEHALFGKDGFEGVVAHIGDIERELGIADLAAFTPS